MNTDEGPEDHFDLAVIGTGSANSIVDSSFADQRVAIFERGVFGGTCLNVGCIPTKMFVVPSDLARAAAVDGPRLGVRTSYDGADWPAIRDRIFGRIDPISAGGRDYRQRLDNVTLFEGSARFVGPRTIDTGTGRVVTADQVVVATGSRPVVPPVEGLADLPFHTSDTVMRLERLPASIAIIGGGFVGAEFAHVFSALGAHVTQIHRGRTLLDHHDADVSARFTELAAWDTRLGRRAERAERTEGGYRLHLDDGSVVEAEELLVAAGRTPNSDGLGLDVAGVELNESGRVVVDEHLRTTADGVWALGDICNEWQLKHVANGDARVVQHNLLHPDDPWSADYRFVPHAVFSDPQVAAVGLTEAQARQQYDEVRTATHDYADVAYGWALEDQGHFVKLVAGDGELVGAHLLGPQAAVLVQPLVQALSLGTPWRDLARGQYWIHPALTEVVENVLLKLVEKVAQGIPT